MLSNVFVLGIKSHKLFPTLFLEGRSESDGNRLEISRGVWSVEQGGGLPEFPDGLWGRRACRSLPQCSLLWEFMPASSCHGIRIGFEDLCPPGAAAKVGTNTRPLSPTPGF